MTTQPANKVFGDFSVNVLSNIVADTVILAVMAIVVFFGRHKIMDLFRMLRFSWRMHKNGVISFYNSRQEYVTARREPSLSAYMLRAKRRFVYVGFYLAGATERDRVDSAITEMLDRGCEIEIVMLDPDAPAAIIRAVERHLAIANGTLQQVLRHAHDHFLQLRAGLSAASQGRFKIALHSEALVSSAMLIDEGEPEGRLLVDNKIHMAGRDRSYGIEFHLDQSADGLAQDFANSFKRIASAAH